LSVPCACVCACVCVCYCVSAQPPVESRPRSYLQSQDPFPPFFSPPPKVLSGSMGGEWMDEVPHKRLRVFPVRVCVCYCATSPVASLASPDHTPSLKDPPFSFPSSTKGRARWEEGRFGGGVHPPTCSIQRSVKPATESSPGSRDPPFRPSDSPRPLPQGRGSSRQALAPMRRRRPFARPPSPSRR